MPDALLKLIDAWQSPKILVVGDVMLDRYVRGAVERISPEAPIPVMSYESEEVKLGGAGAVVLNLAVFGAKPDFVSLAGADNDGRVIADLLEKAGVAGGGLVTEKGRFTTVKTRFIGNVQSAGRGLQHMMRLDREVTAPVSGGTLKKLEGLAAERIKGASCVLLSDYDKGLLSHGLVSACLELARKAGISVIVDPKRSEDYSVYKGATGMTPNRFEAGLATGIDTSTIDGCARAAEKLVDVLGLEWCALTMDKDGMYLAERGGGGSHLATRPRNVYDVSGAGDMVLAATGTALANGNPLRAACRIANTAAGVEVGKIGVATVTRDEMRAAILSAHPTLSEKLKTRKEISDVLDEHRRRAETVVMTNGCFDVLHAGHVQFLSFAKAQGDVLVVALNTDRSVRALKGEGRPVNNEQLRAKVVGAMRDVDYVVLFDEDTPAKIVEIISPDKLVKGEDWRDKGVVGREFVEGRGGEVVLAPLAEGLSTTDTIEKIRRNGGRKD